MSRSTIKGTVTTTVTLGQDGYLPTLEITKTGKVLPSATGADGIVDPSGVSNAVITNHGTVAGAYGAGTGVYFSAAGTLQNTGTINGGQASYSVGRQQYGYQGGNGVTLSQGGSVVNHGAIRGGEGGGSSSGYTGIGGRGVSLYGGTLTNAGHVTGGAAGLTGANNKGGYGGAGVYARGGATIINSGTSTGGAGTYGYYHGSAGGVGVQVYGTATLTNTGTISGGAGGEGLNFGGGIGGTGVYIPRGADIVTNQGLIKGGQGGGSVFSSGFTGGVGVYLQGGTLTNTGKIVGGAGGLGHGPNPLGIGGVGVTINSGELITSGTIAGGTGAAENRYGFSSVAVSFGSEGGTLVLEPGAVFDGAAAGSGNAVLLLPGTTAGTLTGLGVTQFFDFGTVAIGSGAIWELAGPSTLYNLPILQNAGTLSVTGTVYAKSVQDSGTLSVTGTLSAAGAEITASGYLNTGTSGAIALYAVDLAGGHLHESAGGTLEVGNYVGGVAAGTLAVGAGSGISGYGTISADALSVAGSISADGGTLNVHGDISGFGTLDIERDSTLTVYGSVSVLRMNFDVDGNGFGAVLDLVKPGEDTSILSGFGVGDTVDLQKLIATTLTYSGGTLTLLNGTHVEDTLSLAGRYTAANFQLQSDGNNGTDVLYVTPQAQEFGGAALQALGISNAPHHDLDAGSLAFWHVNESGVASWLSAGLLAHKPG
jgi:hypothetical protein